MNLVKNETNFHFHLSKPIKVFEYVCTGIYIYIVNVRVCVLTSIVF